MADAVHSITPEQLKTRLDSGEKLHIVDVREAEEVAHGMIPGAKHIPLGELPDRLSELDPQDELVLVCRSGNRSSRAYQFLEAQGRTKLINLAGGMMAWDQL